jgi:hypothetical protein
MHVHALRVLVTALLHDVHRHRAGEARYVDANHLACQPGMLRGETRITRGKAHHADAALGKPGETCQPLNLPSETVSETCETGRERQSRETLRLRCKARSQTCKTRCKGQPGEARSQTCKTWREG